MRDPRAAVMLDEAEEQRLRGFSGDFTGYFFPVYSSYDNSAAGQGRYSPAMPDALSAAQMRGVRSLSASRRLNEVSMPSATTFKSKRWERSTIVETIASS